MQKEIIREINDAILERKRRLAILGKHINVEQDENKKVKLIRLWFENRKRIDELLEEKKMYRW